MTQGGSRCADDPRRDALRAVLESLGRVAVAVSGGVDSLTLAAFAHRALGAGSRMFHAVSPAVPGEATGRVERLAARYGWPLSIIDAGEFADETYLRNPVDRCFFCKANLYAAVARHTDAPIVSGANRDDLGEYRPGLDAARAHGVRHPYLEAGIDKAGVRALARELGLGDVAELPAAPCLSSRVETGIPIRRDLLRAIHAVERLVAGLMPVRTVRCRVRASGVVIELDPDSLAAVDAAREDELRREVGRIVAGVLGAPDLSFAVYRNGSAFLRGGHERG